MEIIDDVNELPAKIRNHLPNEVINGYIAGIKTTYKPNATIPILWLIVHKNGFVFCSTHRTRGIYKEISSIEVDSIKIVKGTQFGVSKIEFIFKNLSIDDFIVTVSPETDFEEIKQILKSNAYQVM